MPFSVLDSLGWRPEDERAFLASRIPGGSPCRVAGLNRGLYRLLAEQGEVTGRVSGSFRHGASGPETFPAVGDWVVATLSSGGEALIHSVLPRRSAFSRKAAGGTTDEQLIAANVDTVFLVSALTRDFNPRRIERYLVMAWESGARPVIVLNKADLCPDVPALVASLGTLAAGVPVHPVSAATGDGLAALDEYLAPGETLALLGSSGVGKSSLVNRLLGTDFLEVGEVRSDDRGRHTTTARELLTLPGGALVIDTPGMRELQLWAADDGLAAAFADIDELARRCRFRDCAHAGEPGCAVLDAIVNGELAPDRFASYRKLERELAHLERLSDQRARLAEKERWRRINLEFRRNGHR